MNQYDNLILTTIALAVGTLLYYYMHFVNPPLNRHPAHSLASGPLRIDYIQEDKASASPQEFPLQSRVKFEYGTAELDGTIESYNNQLNQYEIRSRTTEEVYAVAYEQIHKPELDDIVIYPIKSTKGMRVPKAAVGPNGLVNDRHWLIIKENGDFVTQRTNGRVALIQPHLADVLDPHTDLTLKAEGMREYVVPTKLTASEDEILHFRVWKDSVQAIDQGDGAAQWLEEFLGEAGKGYRLVRFNPQQTRSTDIKRAPGYQIGFADRYLYLVACKESLAVLNDKLEDEAQIPMERFRANLIFKNCAPFADDQWQCMETSKDKLRFRFAMHCDRCKVTTIDRRTGLPSPENEPTKTLRTFRSHTHLGTQKRGVYFGTNMEADYLPTLKTPFIQVGDQVRVLTIKPSDRELEQ